MIAKQFSFQFSAFIFDLAYFMTIFFLLLNMSLTIHGIIKIRCLREFRALYVHNCYFTQYYLE